MRIAIYSGTIPSTTFIEHLIKGIASKNKKVLLFGKRLKNINYSSNDIKIISTPSHPIKLLYFVAYHIIYLLISDYPLFLKFFKLVIPQNFNSFGQKLRYLGKFLPILNNRPDVLHIQWVKDLNTMILLKKMIRVKIAVSLRGTQITFSPIISPDLAEEYTRNFPYVDKFHAVSNSIAQEALKYGAEPKKISIIRPAVPEEFCKKTFSIKKHGKFINIISVGRFYWIKGYMYALDAINILKQEDFPFIYTIIAKGLSEEVIFQINELQLHSNLHIIDSLSQEEVLKRVEQADIFLLPSIEEGIANVVLESFAVGTIVISTACGGMGEVIRHNNNGWLVPIRNGKAIAMAIKEYTKISQEDISRMKVEAQRVLSKNHLLSGQIKQFIDFYKVFNEHANDKA